MKKFLAILFSVVILATVMAVPAMAAVSPSGDVVYKVVIKGQDVEQEVPAGESITLVRSDNDKEFAGWVLNGEYKIVSGSLTSDTLVIIPLSDITVEETYKDEAGETDKAPETEKEENESDKAPQTGNGALMLTVLLTAGAFVAMVATKKAVRA